MYKNSRFLKNGLIITLLYGKISIYIFPERKGQVMKKQKDPAYISKRKRKFGDRCEGRRLKKINAITCVMPFLMKKRSDALNLFADSVEIDEAEKLVRRLRDEGYKNMGLLHVILASYVRVVSQRPALNRFVSGQRIYARHTIDVNMAIKKELSLDAPDTMIKARFTPEDTLIDVYEKFNKLVEENNNMESSSDFDGVANALTKLPRFVFRFFVWALEKLDYHGWLPKALLNVSPFHGSMIITSMGSLGIQPIYHHIYDFGNLPIFISYGARRTNLVYDADGNVTKKHFVDIKVVTDERIVDGYYYASAFKMLKRIMKNPEQLLTPPETVVEDVD